MLQTAPLCEDTVPHNFLFYTSPYCSLLLVYTICNWKYIISIHIGSDCKASFHRFIHSRYIFRSFNLGPYFFRAPASDFRIHRIYSLLLTHITPAINPSSTVFQWRYICPYNKWRYICNTINQGTYAHKSHTADFLSALTLDWCSYPTIFE